MSGRLLLGAFLLWLAVSSAFFALGPYRSIVEGGGNAPMLEERFGYSTSQAQTWLEALGPAGRSAYVQFQWLDAGVAILGAIVFVLAIAWGLGRIGRERTPWRWLAGVPVLIGVLELLENICLGLTASAHPELVSELVTLASATTMAKLGLSPVGMIAVLGVLLATLVHRLRSRRTPT